MSTSTGNEIDFSVSEAIRTMRAMRRLKPDPVPRELLEQIVELASFAPTGGNTQTIRMSLLTIGARSLASLRCGGAAKVGISRVNGALRHRLRQLKSGVGSWARPTTWPPISKPFRR